VHHAAGQGEIFVIGISANSLRPRRLVSGLCVVIAIATAAAPSFANNYGESLGWQFKTSTDRANQAALLDMIEKKRGGYYAAPVYNTTIARQYNCSIAATSTGNNGGQTALANSPTVSGATSTATGNNSGTKAEGGQGDTDVRGTQTNSGSVASGVTGGTVTAVHGTSWQALNSAQTNSGDQTATVQGSRACAFAALN
jgi:hypothetical protein